MSDREETKFIKNLFFNSNFRNWKNDCKLNEEVLVKILSSHLLIPTFYIQLKNKKILKKFSKKFTNYIKFIFSINKERNIKLIKEIREISNILNENKVEHIFLKGSANIISELYLNCGERMVNDIDILVEKKNIQRAFNTLCDFGYNKFSDNHFFDLKHYPRQSGNDKLFAIELHSRLFSFKKNLLPTNDLFKTKIIVKGFNLLSYKNQLLHNIYNCQINDNYSLLLTYNFRNIIDSILISKKYKISFDEINKDKYIKNYLMILSEIGILESKSKPIYLNLIRYRLKRKFQIFFILDKFMISIINRFTWIKVQIPKFIIDSKYRKYMMRKLMN